MILHIHKNLTEKYRQRFHNQVRLAIENPNFLLGKRLVLVVLNDDFLQHTMYVHELWYSQGRLKYDGY